MTRTRWSVETENIGGLRRLTLSLDTDDPEIVALVEQAAERAGVELVRELAEQEPR